MVFSASWPEAMMKYDNGYFFLRKQLFSSFLGFLTLLFFMNFDYRYFKKLAVPIYIIAIILGLLVFSPLGIELKGARRWLKLGPILFMPSDTLKIASIIFFASFLSNKKDRITSLTQGTIPALLIIGISCGLIVTQDLGTTVTLAGTLMSMFFVAGMKILHLVPLGIGAGGLFWMAITDPDNPHRMNRIMSFKDPFADKLGKGWQAVQSRHLIAALPAPRIRLPAPPGNS